MFRKNTFSLSFWEALFFGVLFVLLQYVIILIAAGIGWPFFGSFSVSFFKVIDFFSLPLSNAILTLVNIIIIVLLLRIRKDGVFEFDWFNSLEPIWIIGTIIMILGITIVATEIVNIAQFFYPMDPSWVDVFDSMRSQPLVFYILEIVIVAPFIEEFMFRGIIARGLNEKYSYAFAIFVSAFMFGVMHLNFWQFVSAFTLGLFLTWLYLYTKSLMLVIFAHGLYNGIPIIFTEVLQISIPGFNEVGTNIYGGQPYLFTGLGVLLIIIGIIIIKSVSSNYQVEY